MKFGAPKGWIASHPGEALYMLNEAARLDGAGDDWLIKALKKTGATRVAVPVSASARYKVLNEDTTRKVKQYDRAMMLARLEVAAVLRAAAEQALLE